jgi:predicted permease
MIHAIRSRLRAVFRRAALDREMRDEMALHVEHATERLKRRGLTDADARDAARREFGNVALLQEEARDIRGARWIESCVADVRFAVRHFSRTPITAITLVLVLSLGIGVNSAVFSVLYAFIMRAPPGVAADESLVRVRGTVLLRVRGRLVPRGLSGPELNAIAAHNETFASVAGWVPVPMMLDLGDGGKLRALRGHFVTPNYFATLGVRTAIGPGLPAVRTDDAPGAELAVVIGHSLWQRFGADTAMIGRIVRVNGVAVRVAGVAPPKFQGPMAGPDLGAYLWMPLAARAQLVRSTAYALASRDSTLLQAVARLTPNSTTETATGVARGVAAAWAPTDTAAWVPGNARAARNAAQYSADVVPLSGVTDLGGEYLVGFALAATGALLILLITCTNVSALLVGAGVARRREIAIRLSLGASRGRLVRQLVTESSLIALAGGALGLMVYWSIFKWMAWEFGDDGLGPDLSTVAFTALIALGTGIIFGLSPALNATRLDVSNALKNAGSGATSRTRLQRAFIVAQICLTQPLLIGLVLVMGIARSEYGTARKDDPLADRLTRIYFNTGGDGHTATPNDKHARVREVMDRVAQLPGVERVVQEAADYEQADFRVPAADRGIGARADETVRARLDYAPPGYLAFRAIPLVRGRDIIASDTIGREWPVVIGNDLARNFWGHADPIGMRLEIASQFTGVVVGVFDTSHVAVRGEVHVYTAHGGWWWKNMYLIRSRGPGSAIIPDVRQLVRASIPDIQVYDLRTLEQMQREDRHDVKVISASAAGGGALALLLASIGLYGVVSLSVRQRHREIGIRVALGARPRQVITMFFTSGLRLSALGIVLGLPLSAVALHLLVSTFAGRYSDTTWLVGGAVVVALAIIVVASLATWIPARRAAGVDPLVAIRVE